MKDFKNDLLKRREVKFLVESQGNPGLVNAGRIIAEEFKADESAVAVKAVKSKFGSNTFLIDAFIYETSGDKDKIEPKKKEKKKAEGAA